MKNLKDQLAGIAALIAAIIAIAQELDLKLVAEGVELQGQADMLLSNGCVLAQGFHYFKPMPLAEILLIQEKAV